jgi:uncharacterized protein involved in exopolysaccharide biosynthesis
MEKKDRQAGYELREYVGILRRRKREIFLPAAGILLLAILAAFLLPVVYRAPATILIESQDVPETFVEATVRKELAEQVQGVMLRVLDKDTLLGIVDSHNLFLDERDELLPAQLAGMLRGSIGMEIAQFQAVKSEDTATATMAIQVYADLDEPVAAADVSNEIAELFLEQDRAMRQEEAESVYNFLQGEGEKLNSVIEELEQKLATFKVGNLNQLPELKDFNMRLYEQTEGKLERTEEEIRSLEDRKLNLEAQMAVTNPYGTLYADPDKTLLSGPARLRTLLTEYLRVSSQYTPNHPDVIKLRREINSLEGQVGGSSKASSLVNKLTVTREQLSELKQKYSSEHPDIVKLNRTIPALERELREFTEAQLSADGEAASPTNPAYVSLRTQLDTVNANLRAKYEQKTSLQSKLVEYEKRVSQTPLVEREYLTLSRGYDNATKKYKEIKDKQLEAQLALGLEGESKAQRLILVRGARVPTAPYSPNRPAFIAIGLVLGLIIGVGVATIAEYSDENVRGKRGVVDVFGAPPLATIPYIENNLDIAERSRRNRMTLIVAGVVVTALLAYAYYIWSSQTGAEDAGNPHSSLLG